MKRILSISGINKNPIIIPRLTPVMCGPRKPWRARCMLRIMRLARMTAPQCILKKLLNFCINSSQKVSGLKKRRIGIRGLQNLEDDISKFWTIFCNIYIVSPAVQELRVGYFLGQNRVHH